MTNLDKTRGAPVKTGEGAGIILKAYINVSVATIWSEPHSPRKIDEPSLLNPVDIPAWIRRMNDDEKRGLVGRIETQALYGTKVIVLEEKEEWAKVAVMDQLTEKNKEGYPGWMPKAQLTFSHGVQADKITIGKPTTWLFYDEQFTKKDVEISFNTKLAKIKKTENAVCVQMPSGEKRWLKKDAVLKVKRDFSGEDIITTGKQFIGLPYLWGGMSGFGFDCSGFVHSLYHAFGLVMARDASEQMKLGIPIGRNQLEVGDALFFAYDNGKGFVHHVGLYAGGGKMLHAPKTGKSIELIDLWSTPNYANDYAGACRYIS